MSASGYLSKQGGAKGGRKSWKRRYFKLKDGCLFYSAHETSRALLGVMHIDTALLYDCPSPSPSPFSFSSSSSPSGPDGPLSFSLDHPHLLQPQWSPIDSRDLFTADTTVCFECKRRFSVLQTRHLCRSCQHHFCQACSSHRTHLPLVSARNSASPLAAPLAVRVCDACWMNVQRQRAEQGLLVDSTTTADTNSPIQPPLRTRQRSYDLSSFTLPAVSKPHLFALKSTERELWLSADNAEDKNYWLSSIRAYQQRSRDVIASRSTTSLPSWEVAFADIVLMNPVGEGSFGSVYRGRLWGTEIAVKTLKGSMSPKEADALDVAVVEEVKREIAILSTLRHPNIVLYVAASLMPPNVCICTEWCHLGSLYDVLHDMSIIINGRQIIELALGISQGMCYLHSLQEPIIHRDLKSGNVLVNRNWQPKVADFGLSQVKRTAQQAQQRVECAKSSAELADDLAPVGTAEWMAPEAMEGLHYTEKVDVWSFGVVLTELVSRVMPYHDRRTISSYEDVVDAVLDEGALPTIPKWVDMPLRSLILSCLSRAPVDRPSFNEIILRLRELQELDDSSYFYLWDIPRIKEQLDSHLPAMQALAASELAALIIDNPRIRRAHTDTQQSKSSVSSPSVTSFSSAQHRRIPTGIIVPLNVHSTLAPLTPANNGAFISGHALSALLSPGKSRFSFGAFGSTHSNNEEIETWLIEDEIAHSVIERLTALLSSSVEKVQLAAAMALSAMLTCSDTIKKRADRELIVNEGGIRALLCLLTSPEQPIVAQAGEVLLQLTADLSSEEMAGFVGLDELGLGKFKRLIESDIERITVRELEMQRLLTSKRTLVQRLQSICDETSSILKIHSNSYETTHTRPRPPRPRNRVLSQQSTPQRKHRDGTDDEVSSFPASPVRSSLLPKFQYHQQQERESRIVRNQSHDRRRSNSATSSPERQFRFGRQTRIHSLNGLEISQPGGIEELNESSVATNSARVLQVDENDLSVTLSVPEPMSSQERLLSELLILLLNTQRLVSIPPDSFIEWYGTILHASYLLHWDAPNRSWHLCYAVCLESELRVFALHTDQCDDAMLVLRLRTDHEHHIQNARLLIGFQSLPHCFNVLDLTAHTFSTGTRASLEMWRQALNADPTLVSTKLTLMSIAPATPRSLSMPTASQSSPSSKPPPHPPSLSVFPPEALSAVPINEQSFANEISNMKVCGYLLRWDDNLRAWRSGFFVLSGSNQLYGFASHRSQPDDSDYSFQLATLSPGTVQLLGETELILPLVGPGTTRLRLSAANHVEVQRWLDVLQPPPLNGIIATSPIARNSMVRNTMSPFLAFFIHIDHHGYLERKKRIRWQTQFVVLVNSEMHLFKDDKCKPNEPSLIVHICTQSGKPFLIAKCGTKAKPFCFEIDSPALGLVTFSTNSEKELDVWMDAVKQAVFRIAAQAVQYS